MTLSNPARQMEGFPDPLDFVSIWWREPIAGFVKGRAKIQPGSYSVRPRTGARGNNRRVPITSTCSLATIQIVPKITKKTIQKTSK